MTSEVGAPPALFKEPRYRHGKLQKASSRRFILNKVHTLNVVETETLF